MAKRSMSDKLKTIKQGEIIPVEQKITLHEGEETPGTSAKIEEEIIIGPEIDPDEDVKLYQAYRCFCSLYNR